MTTAGPDGVLTAADLLFGSSENAYEALTRHVMSAGRTMVRTLARLPRVTREAAVREAAVAAAGLLKVDPMEVLVAGWREHRDIFSAARRTLDMPGSKELVGLAPHRITTVQQPSVGILVDQAGFPAADLADAGHPASAETDHPSASWWEKPQPGPA
jgi:hypothetical protein